MNTGIKFSVDNKLNGSKIELKDILSFIQNGNFFLWALLWLDGRGRISERESIVEYKKEIRLSKNGVPISWKNLCLLANEAEEIYDIYIIASKNSENLHKYDNYCNENDLFKTCDFVIHLIDSSFWIIMSSDKSYIEKLIISIEGEVTSIIPDDFKNLQKIR